jgi:hypothetical protein
MNTIFSPDERIEYFQPYNGYKIVAVIGWAGDFAAYAGPYEWTAEEVARKGNKILEGKARMMFPQLEDYQYRD